MIGKIINTIKVVANYIVGTDIKASPILVGIEPTNNCNLKCIMCPNKKMVRERGYMDLSVFKKIVNQTVRTAWEYSFDIIGEPTMHPDLIEMIGYIKNKGGKVALFTNMNYRNDRMTGYFVKNNVDRIVVNMCTMEDATHKPITKNSYYQVLIHNLAKIKEEKKRLRKRKPIIVGSFLKMKINIDQLDQERKRFQEYFDRYVVLNMHDWADDKSIADLKPPEKISWVRRKCSNLRTTAVILWDGRVAACCYDYEGKVIFGDSKLAKINDIWNSPEAKRFRKNHRNSDLCKGCDEEMRYQFSMRNLYDYFRVNF